MQIYDYDHDSILVRLNFKEARLLGGSLYVALGAGDLYPDRALCPAAERERAQTLAAELLFVEAHKALREKQAAGSGGFLSHWWGRGWAWIRGKGRSRQQDGNAISPEVRT